MTLVFLFWLNGTARVLQMKPSDLTLGIHFWKADNACATPPDISLPAENS